MIKFYGTPITPQSVFLEHMKGRNALVSFAHKQDAYVAFSNCNKVILDNGAFSFWKTGKQTDWDEYYKWVEAHYNREFFFIPDVIDGNEKENDELLKNNHFKDGVPVWHINESLDRLERLASDYEIVAFGSSGEYSELGTREWHKRMDEAMRVVCNNEGYPIVKIHMLRCLNPKIFTKYPFYSGDSTNLARNHARDGARNIIKSTEKYNSPSRYKFKKYFEQLSLIA